VSVTFKTTIVRDKNGQTRLQMANVFKYALNVKIDYIAVMAETDRLDYIFFSYIHNIHTFIEIFYFLLYAKKNHQGQYSELKSLFRSNELLEF